MPTTSFSEEEMNILADKIAERLVPLLFQCLRDKARWTVNQLQAEHFTAKQVAAMFSCSPQTIYKLKDEKKLDYVIVGKSGVRFSRNAIERAQRDGILG